MSKLVHEYMRETWGDNDLSVNTAACRLFVGILPGLESSVVYQVCVMCQSQHMSSLKSKL
jgi:hypothetical protein